MNKLNIGLIGYGIVGSGVAKILKNKHATFKKRFGTDFVLKTICNRNIEKKDIRGFKNTKLTSNIDDVVNDKEIDVIIELIGGITTAKTLTIKALKQGKHVITANKALISHYGKELFDLAKENNSHLYFESSVGAGIPIIKTITEGIAGNSFNAVYGIINGTCNFILDEMTQNGYTFEKALELAQTKGYAEADPTLDINGMDSAHKLSILTYLAFGKTLKVKDIYTEGITHISHDDIANAEKLGLSIKLLAIAKKTNSSVEVRVHPTLIKKEHPLAHINGVFNAVLLDTDLIGDILLSGEGAGQMAAASGVISDLINLATIGKGSVLECNYSGENTNLKLRKIDDIETKFYLRFMAKDNPGVLSLITGILGKHGIGINSVDQKAHTKTKIVPVIMLTDYSTEKVLRKALNKIQKLSVIKSKPVAIRMEKLH